MILVNCGNCYTNNNHYRNKPTTSTKKDDRLVPVVFFHRSRSVHADGAVLTDGDAHAVFHIAEELITQRVYHGHADALQPDAGQDGTGGGQRVDGLGEEHAGGLSVHGAGGVEHQSAGGGADGLGQAQRLTQHHHAVEVRVILVTAGGLLVAELQRLLEGGQGVQTAVGYQGGSAHRTGSDDAALEFSHLSCLPS